MSILETQTRTGEPLLVGATVVVPVSQSVSLQAPGLNGGFVWNRPIAVKVTTADGQETLIPVPDVTRQALLAVAAISMIGALLIRLLVRKH